MLHIAAEMTEQEFEKMVKETIATGYTSTENLSFTHHRNVIYKSRRGIPRFEVCDWWDEACSGFDVINIDNMYGVDPKLNSDHFNEFIRRRNANANQSSSSTMRAKRETVSSEMRQRSFTSRR